MVFDNTAAEKMSQNVPKYRVPLNNISKRNRLMISAYIFSIGAGFSYYSLIQSHKILYPYLYYKNTVQYQAYPDFINNQVTFAQKKVKNELQNF